MPLRNRTNLCVAASIGLGLPITGWAALQKQKTGTSAAITATDPVLRRFVERVLDAYPSELPNRTDISAHALNTNSPQSINTDDATARLPQLAVPALIVHGALDQLAPVAGADEMARLIPGAQVQIIPDAGHMLPYEQPEIFVDALSRFLG